MSEEPAVHIINHQAIQRIADFCNGYLEADDEITNYLKSRHFTKETIARFNLGAWPRNSYAIRKHILDDCLREAKVLWNDRETGAEIVKFKQHRLIIPIYNADGKAIALMGRTILPNAKELGLAKYINTSFPKRNNLFGLNLARTAIRESNKVLVVEGNLDVVRAHQHDMKNVVAVCGSSLTPEQLILLARYTDRVFLGFDNDEAGDRAIEKAMMSGRKGIVLEPKRVPLRYKDLDEYLMERYKQ